MPSNPLPPTEIPHQAHGALDTYGTAELVAAFVDDQAQAVRAVQAALPALAAAVDAAVPRIARGGRLFYVGAGTSGRLGLLDSVELPPTFSWDPSRAVALLAGGPEAVHRAVEGAEDSAAQGEADVQARAVGADDVVLLLAASGSTPYVLGAADAARRLGALTVGLANNPGSPLAQRVAHPVTLDTGPEVISGSTRLKAGTAQKIALNAFSSALMVRLDKVHGNLMVDVRATNAKLVRRAVRLTMLATGCDEPRASQALQACGHHVKTAIVMIGCGLPEAAARQRLEQAAGSVRRALAGCGR
jgi:N-acetylmuramic acid 6-phosphate etherase